jgi:hypothetical protein
VSTALKPVCERCRHVFRKREALWRYFTEARSLGWPHPIIREHVLCATCARRHEQRGWPARLRALQAEHAGVGLDPPKNDPLTELYWRHRCTGCGRHYFVSKDAKHYIKTNDCDGRCQRRGKNQRVAFRRKAARAAARAPRPCAECGEIFKPTRADAKTCSTTCRMRLWRRARRIAAA